MVSAVTGEFNRLVNYLSKFEDNNSIAFDHTTISVNINGLSEAAMRTSAKLAFAAWTGTTGLKFVYTSSANADIVIDDNDATGGAYGGPQWGSDFVTTQATINIPTNWMDGFPADERWGVGSYGLQTFIHEIGHTLGLNHGGLYDGSGTYDADAIFAIDTNQFSIMSYFEQSYYTPNGATDLYLYSPMIADIEAIKMLYGSLSVHTGNTLYGRGETVLGGITDSAKYPDAAYTIKDTSGYDTIDMSNSARAVTLDLRPGYFSNVNGNKGNVTIALGTIIERAYGTNASDTIQGNGAANLIYGRGGKDRLIGDAGNDTLVGGVGADKLFGGSGTDTATYLGATKGVVASLIQPSINTNDARGDTYSSIEILRGSSYNDTLVGNAGGNALVGNAGNDRLIGGKGDDHLYGGTGKDNFVFKTAAESSAIKSRADTIFDFSISEGDRIELSSLDANVKASGNQAFSYLGTKGFTGAAGQLRYEKTASDTYVYCDNDGDKVAEMVVHLDDALSLSKACFIL